MKKLSVMICVFGVSLLFAGKNIPGVELSNSQIKVRILPQRGGKIIAVTGKKWHLKVPEKEIFIPHTGWAKERIWGDQFELAAAPWRVISRKKREIKLSVTNVHPYPFLQIEKRISLPEKGAFIRVDLRFSNRNPVAWGEKFVPWIHHSWRSRPGTLSFSHNNGIYDVPFRTGILKEVTLAKPGNWAALRSEDLGGLFFAAVTKPRTIYSFISSEVTSLEMLYPRTALESKISYILTPGIPQKGTAFPVRMIPEANARRTAAETTTLSKLFRADPGKKGEFRFWKNTAYISSDAAIPLFFGVKPAGRGQHELEIDLPSGVRCLNAVGDYWNMRNERVTIKSTQTLPNGGTRIRFSVQTPRSSIWYPNHCRIFLRADKKGASGRLVWRSFLDSKRISEKSVPLQTLHIPKARIPRSFKVWMGIDYALMKAYPDFAAAMRHFGFNGLCFNSNVPNKVISSDMVKKMNDDLRKMGFSPTVMGLYFVPPGQGFGRALPKKQEHLDLCAVDIDGKKIKQFDFTARGEWMKQVAEKDLSRGMGQGFDIAISDYEAYMAGERISFTPRTLKAFRREWDRLYPKRPWIDPKIAARNPDRYPFEYAAWVEFKCSQYASYIAEMAKLTASGKTALGWCTAPGDNEATIRSYSLEDHRRMCAVIDWHMPMLYNNIYNSMPRYRRELSLAARMVKAGNKARLAPTLSAGFWGTASNFQPDHTLYQMLETALLGAEGAYIFPGFSGADGLGLLYLSRSLDLISVMEPVLKGARSANTLVKAENVKNTAFNLAAGVEPIVAVNGSRALVYIAEYSADPISGKLRFDVSGECRVKVLNGAFPAARVKKGDSVLFSLTSPGRKALLLLLETVDGSPLKIPAAEQTRHRKKSNVVLEDSFDGKTIGSNMTPGHFFSFITEKKGEALSLRDYESAWKFTGPKKLKKNRTVLEFFYRIDNPRLPGSGGIRQIFAVSFNKQKVYRLSFPARSGRMEMAENRIRYGSEEPFRKHRSASDRWPGGIWMKIQLKVTPEKVELFADGRREMEIKPGIVCSTLDFIQFGKRWQSSGAYDDLTLTSE